MEKGFSRATRTTRRALWFWAFAASASVAYYWFALRPLPFDSEQWKRARAANQYDVCYRMSADLVHQLSNQALSSNGLILLLGPPDYPGFNEWRYKLRATFFALFPDDYSLVVWVIPGGRFIGMRVVSG
jgi:hypothetical protein